MAYLYYLSLWNNHFKTQQLESTHVVLLWVQDPDSAELGPRSQQLTTSVGERDLRCLLKVLWGPPSRAQLCCCTAVTHLLSHIMAVGFEREQVRVPVRWQSQSSSVTAHPFTEQRSKSPQGSQGLRLPSWNTRSCFPGGCNHLPQVGAGEGA